MEYTEKELQKMKAYEERHGEEIIIPYSRKLEIYRTKNTEILENAISGISRAIFARGNPENEFDRLDDGWKKKTLKENLEAITEVLKEKNTK